MKKKDGQPTRVQAATPRKYLNLIPSFQILASSQTPLINLLINGEPEYPRRMTLKITAYVYSYDSPNLPVYSWLYHIAVHHENVNTNILRTMEHRVQIDMNTWGPKSLSWSYC